MDEDGQKKGYDLALTRAVSERVGVPVIANDVGGVREMLEDGRYGKITSDDNGFIKLITQL